MNKGEIVCVDILYKSLLAYFHWKLTQLITAGIQVTLAYKNIYWGGEECLEFMTLVLYISILIHKLCIGYNEFTHHYFVRDPCIFSLEHDDRKIMFKVLFSIHSRCVPFDRNISGLRSGLHRVFRHLKWDSNSKGTNMFSLKGTANGIGNKGTSIHHFTGSQWSPLQLIYRVQVGTLSNGKHLQSG